MRAVLMPVSLLGPDVRWGTHTDLSQRRPVTGSTMDALVALVGGGVLVAVLVTDEDLLMARLNQRS
jgi:hypothetical protein